MRRDQRALHRRCAARLRTLPLPDPFDLDALVKEVERQRGRPIKLHPVPSLGGPLGLCVPLSEIDVIAYVVQTTAFHQTHTILHELAHLICGHRPPATSDVRHASDLFLMLRADRIQTVLQRVAYTSEEECEAELLASLIEERCSARDFVLPNRRRDGEINQRLEASLRE